jgi:hypothetical protein
VADWDTTIQACVHAYNTSVHTAHGYTPFHPCAPLCTGTTLVHGYHLSSVYTLYWPASEPPFPTSTNAAAVNQFRQYHHECLADTHSRLCQDADARKSRRSSPIAKQSFYKVGDNVRVPLNTCPLTPWIPSLLQDTSAPFPLLPILTPASMKWILETSTLRPTALSTQTGCGRTLQPLLPRASETKMTCHPLGPSTPRS